MGYRLEISEIKYSACGGKLYGYFDEENFKSRKWLLERGYIDGDEYWSYGCNPQIVLRPDEFKEFIELYNEDWNSVKADVAKDAPKNNPDIKKLLVNENDVLLEWW